MGFGRESDNAMMDVLWLFGGKNPLHSPFDILIFNGSDVVTNWYDEFNYDLKTGTN